MIQVENLTKKFANLTAVKDVSFSVAAGKIWGFLGPNGAGKTTTMRILTGYLPPSEGRAMINGIDVSQNAAAVKKMVGYLPEVVPLYPELTVKEYLRFIAALYGIPRKKIATAVERVVTKANLGEVYGRLIRNISRGYRQRLGIAQSIIHEPQVLILDEPTVGLDPAQIIEIREMISSFKEQSTVILCSHILAEITQVCDGAVIIKDGRLMACLNREEWNRNLEIVIADSLTPLDMKDFLGQFPIVNEASAEGNSLKLEFKETISDINEVLKYLIDKNIRIREVKTGLEGRYMKIISSEDRRPS